MSVRILLVYIWVTVCLLISACSAPVAMPIPNETQQPKIDYVSGVGRILSSASTTVMPQKIHSSQDALWYWFEECGCIAKLDPLSGMEVALLKIGGGKAGPYGNPKDMAINDKNIWVTDAGHFTVVKIDTDSHQTTDQILLEFTDEAGKTKQIRPFGLAIDSTALWVSDFDGNYVVRLDTETKKILAIIHDIRNPEGITVTPGAVWVVEHRSGRIVRIDPVTNTITATISIPVSADPTWSGACGMCINYVIATQDAVWVPLNRGRGVARIDPQTNKVSAVFPLGAPIHNVAISDNAIWAVGSEIGADCEKSAGFVARIDPQTNTVVGKLPIPCAFSVAVHKGNVWVGSGILSEYGEVPTQTQLTLIKPD